MRTMKKQITKIKTCRKRRGYGGSIVAGLASLITLIPAGEYPRYRSKGAVQSLRGDMMRIGIDMRIAAHREKEREEAAR